MLCGAMQDSRVVVERSDRMWSTGEGNGKPLQYSCLENPMNSMKKLTSGYAIRLLPDFSFWVAIRGKAPYQGSHARHCGHSGPGEALSWSCLCDAASVGSMPVAPSPASCDNQNCLQTLPNVFWGEGRDKITAS